MEKKIKGPSLFELSEELQVMIEDMELWAEDHEGDVSEYPMSRLEKLEGDVKDKVLKCAMMYKEWKATGEAIREEEKSLAKRRKTHENRGDRLKMYMESCLPPNAKFENARASVSWKNNPPAVDVLVDAEKLPELFVKRPAPEVDKMALKGAMLEYEVPTVDGLGDPVYDTENKPMVHKEYQVRWPVPVDEQEKLGAKEIVLAKLKQGRSLLIK
jgi:hypothetical protein